MASRGITVKLPTAKVIATLEQRLKEYNNIKDNYPKLKAAQDRKRDAWMKVLVAEAKKKMNKAIDTSYSYNRYGKHTVQVSFYFNEADMPEEFRGESIQDPTAYHFKEKYEELELAIRLLKMSDDEVVSTSTYKSITQFL